MLGGSPPDTAQPPPPAVWRCLSHRHPSTMYPKPCLFSPHPPHLSEQHATPPKPSHNPNNPSGGPSLIRHLRSAGRSTSTASKYAPDDPHTSQHRWPLGQALSVTHAPGGKDLAPKCEFTLLFTAFI